MSVKKIKSLLKFNRMDHYNLETLLEIARDEFKVFDNRELKYKFLMKVYTKHCPNITTDPEYRVKILLDDHVFENMSSTYFPSFYLCHKIKDLVDSDKAKDLTKDEFEQIARREFVKFDNDLLKFRFLFSYFKAHCAEDEDPGEIAQCLVESGTYEYANLQNQWYGEYNENII